MHMLLVLPVLGCTTGDKCESFDSDMHPPPSEGRGVECVGNFRWTTIYALLANPEEYDGVRVAVSGFIDSREREAVLYPDRDRLEVGATHEAIALGSSMQRASPCEEPTGDATLRGCSGRFATVIGCFHFDGLPYFGSLKPFDEVRPDPAIDDRRGSTPGSAHPRARPPGASKKETK